MMGEPEVMQSSLGPVAQPDVDMVCTQCEQAVVNLADTDGTRFDKVWVHEDQSDEAVPCGRPALGPDYVRELISLESTPSTEQAEVINARAAKLLEFIDKLRLNSEEMEYGLDVWIWGDSQEEKERLAVAADHTCSLGFEMEIRGLPGWFCVTTPGWPVGQLPEVNKASDGSSRPRCSCDSRMPMKNISDGHRHTCSCGRVWVWWAAHATYVPT